MYSIKLKWSVGKCILFAAFILSLSHGYCQIVQSERFENEQRGRDEYYSIFSLKQQGLALIRQKNNFEGGKQKWEALILDTLLQKRGNLEFLIDPRYPLIGYEHIEDELFLLYREGETNRTGLELVQLNIVSVTEVKRYSIKPELDFKITHFIKVGSNIVLGGYVSNEPAILIYEPATNQIKVVPGFFQKNNELVELRQNVNGTFNVVTIDRGNRDDRKIVFRTFTEDGTQLLEDIVPMEENRVLQSSIASSLIKEDLMILGTWGPRQGKQSSGFFALPINPFSDQKIKYLAFGELDNFMNYFSPKRAERLKANAREDIQLNQIPSFTAYVNPFRLEENSDGFILLAEVYNPSRTVNPYYNNPYGSPFYSPYYGYNPFWPAYYPGMRMYRPGNYGPNVRQADEIKSLAGILIAFDATGKKLWDHSITFNDIKKPSLEQLSDFYLGTTNAYLLYKKESEIIVKIIDRNSGSAEERKEKITLKDPADMLRNENKTEDGIKHWYNNSFYCWGYQTIKNVNNEDRVRDVFYINKITIR